MIRCTLEYAFVGDANYMSDYGPLSRQKSDLFKGKTDLSHRFMQGRPPTQPHSFHDPYDLIEVTQIQEASESLYQALHPERFGPW